MKLLLCACGIFYGILCIFSIVTGLLYAMGKRELNPLELSDSFNEKLNGEGKREAFAKKMGWVTFAVGIVQGIASYAILLGRSPLYYWTAVGFTLFSIASVSFKLKGKISTFAVLKAFAYIAVLMILILPAGRAFFF